MVEIGAFAVGIIMSLVANIITKTTDLAAVPYFRRRKIEARVEDATAEIIEPLLPFLEQEGINDVKQRLLFTTCVDELRPLSDNPRQLFVGSLDGQKIYDSKYSENNLPQVVKDEGLEHIYSMLFPRIATLLCLIPSTVKDWENHAWTENYRRLDMIATELRDLFHKVDSMEAFIIGQDSGILSVARKSLALRIGIELDLTGLRSDIPISARFEDLFVHPALEATIHNERALINSASDSVWRFLNKNRSAEMYNLNIVIGEPGAGKSTWSQWLQREALTNSWMGLPIRVELRRLDTENLPSLYQLVREHVTPHIAEDITHERIRQWSKDSLIVFILDGFDEVPHHLRDKLWNWLDELRLAIEKCSIILTSRPLTTSHLQNISSHCVSWKMNPFDKSRIVDYIKRWYSTVTLLIDCVNNVNPESLTQEWYRDPTIAPLTGNPLLLSTLLMVHHLDGSLPSGRAQLYNRYVEGMLGLWDARRKVKVDDSSLDHDERRSIIKEIALYFQFEEKEQLDENEVIDLVKKSLRKLRKRRDAQHVLDTLRERSGLIVGPGIYSFIHKSVAEFLVAQAVFDGDQKDISGKTVDRFFLFEQRDNDKWNAVTFLWAGLASTSDVESFVKACLDTGDVLLGSGILMDQYHRFSPDTRRHFALSIMRNDYLSTLHPKQCGFWHCGHSAHEIFKLPSYDIKIRGLSHVTISDLLITLAEDGLLLWSDASDLDGVNRELLWMIIVIAVCDFDDWKECIKSTPPACCDTIYWQYWIAERFMVDFLAGKPEIDIAHFLEAYRTQFPDLGDYPLIALMSVLVAFQKTNYFGNFTNDIVKRALKLFCTFANENLETYILMGTEQWFGYGLDYSNKENAVDLPQYCLNIISDWANKYPKYRDKCRAANDFVTQIIAYRK